MSDLVTEAARFLKNDGRPMVLGLLRRHALPPHLFDDVVQEVLIGCHHEHQLGTELHEPRAFATRLAQRRVRDMLRGHLRRPEGHLAPVDTDDDEVQDPIEQVQGEEQPEDDVIAIADLDRLGPVVDAVRRDLGRRLRQHPERAAGALAVVAITHDDAVPSADCPRPGGGVAQSESVMWAGVFYGGCDRCFPDDADPENQAMRKRRSRALGHLKDTLRNASEDLVTMMGTDDA